MRVVAVIPARLDSERLPRKLLLAETGKPLIQHTWERACAAKGFDEVLVATDSQEILDTVRRFGGRCELTGRHICGTDRVAEAAARFCLDADIVVNLQADEPEIVPVALDTLVRTLAEHPAASMATLAAPRTDPRGLADPAHVKAVLAANGRALYFSRSPVPYCRKPLESEPPWLLHIGVYAFRREFLIEFSSLPPSWLERRERLEQLRALEAGAVIQVAVVDHWGAGIDTLDDYAEFVARYRMRECDGFDTDANGPQT